MADYNGWSNYETWNVAHAVAPVATWLDRHEEARA